MRYKKVKKILIFWCLFIALGALYGSISMLIDPSGKLLQMDNLLPYFKVLPFSNILFKDYTFSGIALLIVNGLTNLLAAFLLLKNKKLGIVLGGTFGITLMLWTTIQFIIFPPNALSTTFFIFGLLQLVAGYITYVFYIQEEFKFDINKYNDIGKNKDSLVVYYSRMGYTKMIAYEEANKLKSDILELEATEKTKGTLGFWWCGRYGMLKKPMSIKDIDIDLNKYKKVVIVSPIWVFDICAPIREFCYKYGKDINNVSYIFTHFMKCNFTNDADSLDKVLNKKRESFTSICIRFGKIKKYNVLK